MMRRDPQTGRMVRTQLIAKNGIRCDPNPSGTCMCGCGEPTATAATTHVPSGRVEGMPNRYLPGHQFRVLHERTPVRYPTRGIGDGGQYEHILIAERVLGKPLPEGAQVHHVNGDKNDNRPQNLVICENQAYHGLLHARQRARDACGNPDARRCNLCGKYDTLGDDMSINYERNAHYHRSCKASYERFRRNHSGAEAAADAWRAQRNAA